MWLEARASTGKANKLALPPIAAVSISKPRFRISATAVEPRLTNTGIVCPRSRMRRVTRNTCVSAPDMCDGVTLRADMHEEKEPTPEELQAILKKPDGEKQLDAIKIPTH